MLETLKRIVLPPGSETLHVVCVGAGAALCYVIVNVVECGRVVLFCSVLNFGPVPTSPKLLLLLLFALLLLVVNVRLFLLLSWSSSSLLWWKTEKQ